MQARSFALTATLMVGTLATAAHADQLLFEEDFSQGLDRWETTDWYVVNTSDPCGAPAAPFPSGNAAVRFGAMHGACFFEIGDQLDLRDPLYLPASASEATLRFMSYEDTECETAERCKYDNRYVQIAVDDGPFETLTELVTEDAWYEVELDLTPYLGHFIRLRFEFDAFDSFANDGLGWLIDDVSIAVDGVGQTYCSPGLPNSTGQPGNLHALGSRFVANNNLTLIAEQLPLNQFGYFIASQTSGLVVTPGQTLGNLCVLGNVARFNAQVQNSGTTGTFQVQIDLTAVPMNPVAPVLAGETWHFQTWHRDGSFSNFTNAVRIAYQ